MKGTFNSKGGWFSASAEFNKTFQLPKTATLEQLEQFEEKIDGIMLTPMEAVNKAYEDCFGEILDDDAEEESPNLDSTI